MIIYSLLTIEREANEVFLGVSSREEARVYWFLKIIRFIGHNSCESFPMPCLKELQLSSVFVCTRISREVVWGGYWYFDAEEAISKRIWLFKENNNLP